MKHSVATARLFGDADHLAGPSIQRSPSSQASRLHIDGEMPAGALQERLMWTMNGTRPAPGMLQFLIGDLEDLGIGNLASPEVQQSIEPYLDGVSLVTLDNLSSLTAAIRDNDAESWGPIQDWLLRLRRRGIAVLIVHHAGKGGDQRGTSRREDVLDTSIALLRPSDYEPQQGARFEVHLRKARGILGDEVAPFEARLVVNGADATWTMEDLTNVEHERVARLLGDGLSIRDIATETGMSKSAVHRLKSKIDEQKTRDAFRSGLGRIEPYDFNELS